MGSWSDINIDCMMLWSSKSYLDQDALSLFQERDRRVIPDPEAEPDDEPEVQLNYQYAVAAQEMRDRLDVLGFTLGRARTDYAPALAEEVAMREEWLADSASHVTAEEVAALKSRSFEVW